MAKFIEYLDPDMPTPSAYSPFSGGYVDSDDHATPKAVHFAPQPAKEIPLPAPERTQYVTLYDKCLQDASPVAHYNGVTQTFPRAHRHQHQPHIRPRDVFERLTDHRFFTGIHRERFDEHGNGRGLAGREDVYIHDGNTESSSRIHEVYSTVLRKPRAGVLTRGTLGVQKYGVQISTPKLMWLYRNGDKFHDGVAFYVRPFIKSMDILFLEMAKELTLIAGPIRKIYDQNLNAIRSIEDIVDGAKYLCTSGEPPAPAHRLEKFMSEWVVQRFGH